MFDEATPRAQLHLQRILGRDRCAATLIPSISTMPRSSQRLSAPKSPAGHSDPLARTFVASTKSSPKKQRQRVSTPSRSKAQPLVMEPMSASLPAAAVSSLRAEEARGRRALEDAAALSHDMLRRAAEQCGAHARTVTQLSQCLARVLRFVRTPAEAVLRDPTAHLMRLRDSPAEGMRSDEMLYYLQRIPAAITASYESIAAIGLASDSASASVPHEGDDPVPVLFIPQPHPPQQQTQRGGSTSVVSEMGLFVRRPSSLCSRGGSTTLMQRPPTRSGLMSPRIPLANGSFDSLPIEDGDINNNNNNNDNNDVDDDGDSRLGTAFFARSTMRSMEYENGSLMENLREENTYWQEETLRAMADAERYHQLASLVLGWPAAAATATATEVKGTEASGTAAQLSQSQPHSPFANDADYRSATHRAFAQLLLEKEEGGRGAVEAKEAEARWALWDMAADRQRRRGRSRSARRGAQLESSARDGELAGVENDEDGVLSRAQQEQKQEQTLPHKAMAFHQQRGEKERNGEVSKEAQQQLLDIALTRIEELEKANALLHKLIDSSAQ